jgi:hypothetical protein
MHGLKVLGTVLVSCFFVAALLMVSEAQAITPFSFRHCLKMTAVVGSNRADRP